jgi:phosphohistidine phosphatase
MELYLMRHAEATTAEQDPRRPLTEAGRAAATRVAARAAAVGTRLDRVCHSDALRASQTAQLLADRLGVADRTEVWPELSESARDVGAVARRLRAEAGRDGALALVGHMPLLGRLASHLVAGSQDAEVVRFAAGALVRLESRETGERFTIGWALPPELA